MSNENENNEPAFKAKDPLINQDHLNWTQRPVYGSRSKTRMFTIRESIFARKSVFIESMGPLSITDIKIAQLRQLDDVDISGNRALISIILIGDSESVDLLFEHFKDDVYHGL
jgi:hypothetical protein